MNEWDIAIKALRLHGRFILVGLCCGLALAICIILFQKPVWQVEMVVGPTERTAIPSLSSFLPKAAADAPALQYFVNRIDTAGGNDFTRFETVLNSPQTIDELINKPALLLPTEDKAEFRLWLDDHFKILPLGLTPYRKITLRHTDADMAVAVLHELYAISDRTVRQDSLVKTNRRIAYLKDQLDQVRHPDHQSAMIALLKEQEQKAMMASIDNAFAADMIRAPSPLPQPVAPNPVLLIPLLTFAGGLCGLMTSGLFKALKT